MLKLVLTRKQIFIILGLMLAVSMDVVNGAIPSVAISEIQGGTHASPDEIAWVNMAYTMAKVIFFIFVPRIAERMGRKRLLEFSIAIVMAASVSCLLFESLPLLILSRILQGAGSAAFFVTGTAILFLEMPLPYQGAIQAVFALATLMLPVVAPFFCGLLTDQFSWQFPFLLNIPFGLGAFYLLRNSLDFDSPRYRNPKIDLLGIGALATSVVSLLFVLTQGTRDNWFDDSFLVSVFVLGALSLLYFIRRQLSLKNHRPILDVRIFAVPEYFYGFLVSFISGYGLTASGFLIPIFMRGVLHYNSADTGLVQLPSGLFIALGLAIGGYAVQSKKFNLTRLVWAGILLFALGMLQLSFTVSTAGEYDLMVPLFFRGIGFGLLSVPTTIVAFSRLKAHHLAHAAGLFNTGKVLGGALGTATLGYKLAYHSMSYRFDLLSSIFPGNPVVNARLASAAHTLAQEGLSPGQATKGAIGLVNRTVNTQALVLALESSFMEIFLVFLIFAVIIIQVIKPAIFKAAERRKVKLSQKLERQLDEREAEMGIMV